MITVRELIEQLKQVENQELPVIVYSNIDEGGDVMEHGIAPNGGKDLYYKAGCTPYEWYGEGHEDYFTEAITLY